MSTYSSAVAAMAAALVTGARGSITPEILNQVIKSVTDVLLTDSFTGVGDAAHDLDPTDNVVGTTAALTASRTWMLPSAASVNTGHKILVADFFGGVTGTNTLVVARAGSDTVNGGTSIAIGSAYGSCFFISDGVSKWTAQPLGTASGVTTVFGRSGIVVLANGDITAVGLDGSVMSAAPGMLNGTIVASVAANALTFAVKTLAGTDPSASDPVLLAFRDATAATGDYVLRRLTSALSITVPSGQAVGSVNSQAFALWVGAIDNAGAIELCVFNSVVGGPNPTRWGWCPQEGALVATTAIASAPSAATLYSTTARTSKAFKLLGRAEWSSGLVAAGSWSSAPTVLALYPHVPRPGTVLQTVLNTASSPTTTTSASLVATALSISIAAVMATSVMEIDVDGNAFVNGSTGGSSALFATLATDSGATRIGTTADVVIPTGTSVQGGSQVHLNAVYAPGVITSKTYGVYILLRAGTSSVSWNLDSFRETIRAREIMA